ncbi:MAG: hypothetical protein HYS86_01330 [Candidatus Chisholmbacteria bacterium]|nr:hypothetical protein [Candidatus Chisholmbacteria bacterium]
MDYYRNSVTQKSWELLITLKRQYRFVLIGGWAVWFYTRQLKSKDIDVVVELAELERLRLAYDLTKNERLKKYEFRQDEVEVDVYTPFYSELGIPAEEITKDVRVVEGFHLPAAELLLTLKAVAWEQRRASPKGRKDWLDILSLLQLEYLDKDRMGDWLSRGRLGGLKEKIREAIKGSVAIPELNLNRHQIARVKTRWLELVG